MSNSNRLAARTGTALLWRSAQQFGSHLIDLMRLVVLARLLAPDDFGLLALALVPLELLLTATNFGMVAALVQRQENDARHYDTAWTVGMYRSLAVSALVFLAAPAIASLAGEPRVTDLIRLLAVAPLLEATASIRLADLTRKLDFRSLAGVEIAKAVANFAAAALLAPLVGVWALVIGRIFGALVYTVASYLRAPYIPRLRVDRKAASSLIRFGRWMLLTGLIAVAGSAVLRLLVSRHLGAAELGLYYLAFRIAMLPADIAGQVVGAVSFPAFATIQHDLERTRQALRGALTGITVLLAPVCLLMIALAPSLGEALLGPEWSEAAPLLRLLSLAALVGILGEIVVPVFNGFGKPSRVTALEATQSLLMIALLWPLVRSEGLLGAALAWLPAIFLSQILAIAFMRNLLPGSFAGLWHRLLAILASAAAAASLAWWIDRQIAGLLGLLLASAAGALASALLVWWLDGRLGMDLAVAARRLFPKFDGVLRRQR